MKKIALPVCICFVFCSYTLAQNVGIGTAIPAGKLHVKGSADVSQLIIDANSTQSNTNPLIKLRNSSGTELLWIHSDSYTNTFVGLNAGIVNNAGGGGRWNTFIGSQAGESNTTGDNNTSCGNGALFTNTTGDFNTAIGAQALVLNTTAGQNIAIGYNALSSQSFNPGGSWVSGNVAIGFEALRFNDPSSELNGIGNTAVGNLALWANNIGYRNTAIGDAALYYNTSGTYNTASGRAALYNNTSGVWNTANGNAALANNNGVSNTAMGYAALYNNTGGGNNTSVGTNSGTASGNLHNTVSIGNATYLNGASNQAFFGGTSTNWNGGNVTWFLFSDARIKKNVQEDVKGLDFITRLRPVTYYRSLKAMAEITGNKECDDYPGKYDIEKIKFTGFLAQEVEQAAKNANYDFSGITIPKNNNELYTMSYEVFVVPLVKAVQELNDELKSEVASLRMENIKLAERLEKLESMIVAKNK